MPIDHSFHNKHITIVIYIAFSAMTIASIILTTVVITLIACYRKDRRLESLTFPLETLDKALGSHAP
jgi:hypothetical protein